MSEILAIYSEEPPFPPQAQQPNAARWKIGDYWVDAVGPEPPQEQVDAFVNPPHVKRFKEFDDDGDVKALSERLRSANPDQLAAWIDQDEGVALLALFKLLIARRLI